MSYYSRTLQTIPGRDAKPAQTIDRAAWLRRYLAERAAFSWTAEYQARLAELATLEAH